MFAFSEVPVEGLGYSPFELLFGILRLIKKSCLRKDLLENVKSTNIIDLFLSIRDRIRVSIEIANEMAEKAKKYNRKARDVSYEVGEQVSLLLPLIGKPHLSNKQKPSKPNSVGPTWLLKG